MHPPCELMVKRVLPAARALVTHELVKEGFSQGRIATLLGVTQAAVSQYLAVSSAEHGRRIRLRGLPGDELERMAPTLAEELREDAGLATRTLYGLWRMWMVSGQLRHTHEGREPIGRCQLCTTLFAAPSVDAERAAILAELAMAARQLEQSPKFQFVMPQVAVNLVACAASARSPRDVAAFPGRIVRIGHQARALLPPEFGASSHMARVLLAAHATDPSIRALTNLRYDRTMKACLRQLRLRPFLNRRTDGDERTADPVVAAVERNLTRWGKVPLVVADEGGRGLEPMTYLFGQTVRDVIATAIKLAGRYAPSVRAKST